MGCWQAIKNEISGMNKNWNEFLKLEKTRMFTSSDYGYIKDDNDDNTLH
jgi:hypothetical protein